MTTEKLFWLKSLSGQRLRKPLGVTCRIFNKETVLCKNARHFQNGVQNKKNLNSYKAEISLIPDWLILFLAEFFLIPDWLILFLAEFFLNPDWMNLLLTDHFHIGRVFARIDRVSSFIGDI